MWFVSLLSSALAGPPMVEDVVIGEAVPAARQRMCAPIGGNAYRCQAQAMTVNGVQGNMAIERCKDQVFGVKFVTLVVPGSGHRLDGAMKSENPLDDARGQLDKLRAYFSKQGFSIPAPGDMGPAVVEAKANGARLELQMGPVTDVPELPPGAWQAGFVLASETVCGG